MIPPALIVLPRDSNPYQELLYAPMRRRGIRIHYAAGLTPSHTLNLLLLPFEFFVLACRGYRILHLHWTYGFTFPGSARFGVLRRLARLWFTFTLRVAGLLRLKLVWTAHNVLPHGQIFDDDARARKIVVGQADLVIAHSEAALDEIAQRFGVPRSAQVIPHGPFAPPPVLELPPPTPGQPRKVLFFGRVEAYKGVEDLLAAVRTLGPELRLRVAGRCSSPELRQRILDAAASLDGTVELRLDYIPDDQLPSVLAAADALVYPYRTATTSGSVRLGMAAGRAVIVPDIDVFSDVPGEAAIRYPPGVAGLRSALVEVAAMPDAELVRKGTAARAAVESSLSWDDIAERTSEAFGRLAASNGRS